MSVETELRRLQKDVGELVAVHDRGRSLEDFSQYADDPVGFAEGPLGMGPFWDGQRKILEGIRDHRLFYARSAHLLGKTYAAAAVVPWWLYCRAPSCVVTLAPTERQTRELLWGEIRSVFLRCEKLAGELFQQSIRVSDKDRHFAIGFTGDNSQKITGFHHPNLLVVVDESHQMPAESWANILSLAGGSENKILAIGNPGPPFGPWYDLNQRWPGVHLSAFDHPNLVQDREVVPGAVSREWVDTMRTEYGEQSPVYISKVLGEFPSAADDALVEPGWIQAAIERGKTGELRHAAEHESVILACDPARFGPDETVVAVRQGPVLRELIGWRGKSTIESEERVRREAARLRAELEVSVHVVVDEIGIGAGLYDRLSICTDLTASAFNSAKSAADPERYANERASAFWTLRMLLEEGLIALPNDERLREELVQTRWGITSSGLIKIEKKDDLKARLGRSPDRADAVAMAFSVTTAEPYQEVEYGFNDFGAFVL